MMTTRLHSICMSIALCVGLLIASGCAATPPPVGGLRFANRLPVWLVNDQAQLIVPPAARGFPKLKYYFDRFFYRPVVRSMEVRSSPHAQNVNSLDEVPNSTWFTNRIGRGGLSAEEVRIGLSQVARLGKPQRLRVTGTKVGGKSPGLLYLDEQGAKYILKFDETGQPEMETGADIVAQRLLWAAGFNVPDDNVIIFRREQLVLADDAKIRDTFGNKRPMTNADLEATLALLEVQADGSYRGLASRFLPGFPIGGIAPEGTRSDDPNDVVPHQHRRELRGQYVFFSWLNHTDVKQDNTLDMYDPKAGYVTHYLVDFGKALGSLGWIESREEDGFAYSMDVKYIVTSLLTLGVWRRPWEGADGAQPSGERYLGVGRFESKEFTADGWKPAYPWEPFNHIDRFDGFWAAKIVARFRPEHIRAAVMAAQYSSKKTSDYIVRTLIERQSIVVRHWFANVSALDEFSMDGDKLCFSDLNTQHQSVVGPTETAITASLYGHTGRLRGRAVVAHSAGARFCADVGEIADYTIVRFRSKVAGAGTRTMDVHLNVGASAVPQVIGLERH